MRHVNQGIVHVIGPELGFTLPGLTVVCGDSHTSTHGAFGALAFGIGTTEIEHVLATQTLVSSRLGNVKIEVNGVLPQHITSKDVILYTIGRLGTAGATGMAVEFMGSTISGLSMEGRMSLCNMSVEVGAKAGLVAPDETTVSYLEGKPLVPHGEDWVMAKAYWSTLKSDLNAKFDRAVLIDASEITPHVTWGTSPEQVVPITGSVPDPADIMDKESREACKAALKYMDLRPGTPMQQIKIDKVFIGSCTNGRLEDLRAAARVLKGSRISPSIKLALAVPGSTSVKHAAELEGLDLIFKKAGFAWRASGCSLCVGLNEDMLMPGERCASTSNRNFEDRQGAGGRTHLMSPGMAAAAAIAGHLTDVRNFDHGDLGIASLRDLTVLGGRRTQHTDILPSPPHPSDAEVQTSAVETVRGRLVPLHRSNIDTDCIIPKQFLKSISRAGYGSGLFYHLRYPDRDTNAKLDPRFCLNVPKFRGASILLVTGRNFGCGSSREHAIWALQGWGFECVIAPSFGDIFYNNAFQCGLLPIRIESSELMKALVTEAELCREVVVDLVDQEIRRATDDVMLGTFKVEDHYRRDMLLGLDKIELTLQGKDVIDKYESDLKEKIPWAQSVSFHETRGTTRNEKMRSDLLDW